MKWHKFIKGLGLIAALSFTCLLLGFLMNCVLANDYNFRLDFALLLNVKTYIYWVLFMATLLLIWLMYYYKHYWLKNMNRIIKGNKRDNGIEANLEQARFQTDREIDKNFARAEYDDLAKLDAGIPVRAEQVGKNYNIHLAKNTHCLIIGTTGSGKTTTLISPSIQILSETKDKPSLMIADPKGELYMLHGKSLETKGYNIKVLDLRNPFNSIKWNPLEKSFLTYQRMLRLEDEIETDEEQGTYVFEGNSYYSEDEVKAVIQVKKQQLFDVVYEDLHDIITVLCPITNKNEPIWESGAKNLTLAISLAMLEDSENPELGMTVDKYNFYNLSKVATNTDNDCEELLNYFQNRSPVSRSLSLSKQVLESAEKTRGSYLSTMFDKLNMFADLSLCSLTSENELTFDDFAEKPTALFLQIPDERETRHALASMLILQAYKELVKKANTYSELSLPRPVYFLLDEFGNLPAVYKLEQMITVGRSRNIWLDLVVQSYAQLAKVYDDKVAEIIKSNCNIQVFIGTTDIKTIEDFSKRCGNYSVITRNVGYNTVKADDINSNASIKERPLIYPSELAQLNGPGNMGNAIVTVFGYHPIKSRFTPSFKVTKFKLEKTEQKQRIGKFFDEAKVFYDMKMRNRLMVKPKNPVSRRGEMLQRETEIRVEQIMELTERSLKEILSDEERKNLLTLLKKKMYMQALKIIETANQRAIEVNMDHLVDSIDFLRRKIEQLHSAIRQSVNQLTRHQ